MLPVCLRIGGFNACFPGVLVTRRSRNLKRIAGTRVLDIGMTRLWTTPCGTHIFVRLSIFAAFELQLRKYFYFLRLRLI